MAAVSMFETSSRRRLLVSKERTIMFGRNLIGAIAHSLAMFITIAGAQAFDESKYPDWSGQWTKPSQSDPGNPWDPTKPWGLRQEAPLTPDYQAVFEASIADQALGGPGNNFRVTCLPVGVPRVMTLAGPMEIVMTPKLTYLLFSFSMPRRIYTDGRDWPKSTDRDGEPGLDGYSIGKWIDEDDDGRYDRLDVETRNFDGPRALESSGLPMHEDNQTIVREKIYLDKTNKNFLIDEITIIDNAFTRPWTVIKRYQHHADVRWVENVCEKNNDNILIGKDSYLLSVDGYLMPVKKDQPPPDLRYFKPIPKQ
jgi:hypothetical protein